MSEELILILVTVDLIHLSKNICSANYKFNFKQTFEMSTMYSNTFPTSFNNISPHFKKSALFVLIRPGSRLHLNRNYICNVKTTYFKGYASRQSKSQSCRFWENLNILPHSV